MYPRAHRDYESRSTVNLKDVGAHVYAAHPSTEVLVAVWIIERSRGEYAKPIVWHRGDEFPPDIRALIDGGGIVCGHNAAFEAAIDHCIGGPQLGWPVPELARLDCTMARAAVQALPLDLDTLCRVLNLPIGKDREGHRLMLQMCRPRKPRKDEDPNGVYWLDDADRMARLTQYCIADVWAEIEVDRALRPLQDQERPVWLLDQIMNNRGVQIDRAFIDCAEAFMARASRRADARMKAVTAGAVEKVTQLHRLKDFAKAHGIAFETHEKTRRSGEKYEAEASDREALEDLLEEGKLPTAVREAFELRLEAGKSSLKKLAKFRLQAPTGRARGNLQYHAASPGRWAGRGIQLQNLVRKGVTEPGGWDQAYKDMRTMSDPMFEMVWGSPFDVVSRMMRGALIAAPGKQLYFADFANVEARGCVWAAGQEDVLKQFADGGPLYEEMGAAIFHISVDEVIEGHKTGKNPLPRWYGKTVTLGCFSADTLVLTQRGWVPIVNVDANDHTWDGLEWTRHEGVIARGRKIVEKFCKVNATPDHEILTEHGWEEWRAVHINPFLFQSALNSAILPWCDGIDIPVEMDAPVGNPSCDAVAAMKDLFQEEISDRDVQHDAMPAQSKLLLERESIIGDTLISVQMTDIENVCSTGFLPAFNDATIRTASNFSIMEDEESLYMLPGARTDEVFSHIFSPFPAGKYKSWNSTESTMKKDMNPAISNSSLLHKTSTTDDQLPSCNNTSSCLKERMQTYDIACTGPRNRFTILSGRGPLIVHNCGYGMGWKTFQRNAKKTAGLKLEEAWCRRAVGTWRERNPAVVEFWKQLERAACRAVRHPGQESKVGAFTYRCKDRWLQCRLPSGRLIWYRHPSIEATPEDLEAYGGEVPDYRHRLHYWGVDGVTKQWCKEATWGGKLLENCLTNDTKVLTSNSWKCIIDLQQHELIFDGVEWVAHGGVVERPPAVTIGIDGVRMTPDHEVLTTDGWIRAAFTEGLYRAAVRLPDSHTGCRHRRKKSIMGSALRLWEHCRAIWQGTGAPAIMRLLHEPAQTQDAWHVVSSGLCGMALYDRSLPTTDPSVLAQLWGTGHQNRRSSVGTEFRSVLGGHGTDISARSDDRTSRQQRGVLQGELLLGGSFHPGTQQTHQPHDRDTLGGHAIIGSGKESRSRNHDTALSNRQQLAFGPVVHTSRSPEPVFDILNCGPRQRFVVLGDRGPFIVHNCIQGMCADFLRHALLGLEAARYWPVLSIHDEPISEVEMGFGSVEEYVRIVSAVPPWATGFPLKATGGCGTRYAKA